MKLPLPLKNFVFALSAVGIILGCWQLAHPFEPPNPTIIISQSNFDRPSEQSLKLQQYRPVSPWLGRLILPVPERKEPDSDLVLLEVYHAPKAYQNLEGRVVRLQWSQKPEVQRYVQTATQDVNFTAQTQASMDAGMVHPQRLDGRFQVGPLESLAGARDEDDVIVSFQPLSVRETDDRPVLEIDREPTQVADRFYGLVQIIRPVGDGEKFEVRHYNPASGEFDGGKDIVRIPKIPPNRNGIAQSTATEIETSPAGEAGWYIYGAADKDGVFVVRGIEPRSLLRLEPKSVVLGVNSGLNYLNRQLWQQTSDRKGQIETVLLGGKTTSAKAAISNWQEGDKALVMHLFGGIGGEKAEAQSIPATVTGHFSYGIARVVRDAFTGELRFQLQYQQVYAHNPNGIISGNMDWSAYMGDRQRGWLGTRPVADWIVKLDSITEDYNFGGIVLSPLGQLQQELETMMARYRLGDGTGAAIVTPAKSCVQDSNQALYKAIQRLEQQVKTTPEIQRWLDDHPQDPQTQRFRRLVKLGRDLEQELAPLGIVRADWQQNADFLAGIGSNSDFISQNDWFTQLLSWRTLLPRYAHDRLARIFWNHGAQLWLLQTYQVGGWDGEIAPLAPTLLLGRIPLLSGLLFRVLGGLATVPYASGWRFSLTVGLLYAGIALAIGFTSGFLRWHPLFSQITLASAIAIILSRFWFPAFFEELVFRVLLLPHPTGGIPVLFRWLWGFGSLSLFVLYHPLNARIFYPQAKTVASDPVFLTLAGLLGLACTLTYWQTGSILPGLLLHWLVVVAWRLCLGG